MKLLPAFAFCLAIAPAHAGPERSPYQLQAPGSVCLPTSPDDAHYVNYLDGAVRASKPASVTCALPPSVPGYAQDSAYVTYWDGSPAWGRQKCTFYNSFPTRSWGAVVREFEPGSVLGQAVFPAAKAGFVAHAVVCEVLPGQMLYAVTVDLRPW